MKTSLVGSTYCVRLPRNKAADHAVAFINNLSHTGDFSGQPFRLRRWQEQIVRRIFGTLDKNRQRQIQRVFLLLPRGGGKTELCAAIALLCLFCFPPGQQILSAGSDREQAARIFDAARQMVEADEFLSELCTIVPSQKRLVIEDKHSFYCALSADARRKHSLNPSVVLFDELHTQANHDLWDALNTGIAKRKNPLWISITTAGIADPNHIAFQEFDYARKIAGRIENGEIVKEGSIDNPHYLSVLYFAEADEPCRCKNNCEEGWQCEAVWWRAEGPLGAGGPRKATEKPSKHFSDTHGLRTSPTS